MILSFHQSVLYLSNMNKPSLLEMRMSLLNILNEVGDLEGVEAYPYSNNTFTTDQGWQVTVELSVIPFGEFQLLNIPTKRPNTINVEYTIEGEQSQYKKTTYKELIKILKTVTDIVLQYVKDNPKTEALVFFAANKDPQNLLTKTDSQKSALYKTIVVKRLSQLGPNWKLKDVEIGGSDFSGFVIYKTKL
jgi:hypothetical protein